MSKRGLSFFLFLILFVLSSCTYGTYEYYEPVYMTHDELKKSFSVIGPKETVESGKIYLYGKYIFLNEPYKGIHILDNSDPVNPVKIGFIKVLGNLDMAVRNDYLFADSYSDLLVIDISDMSNDIDSIEVVSTHIDALGYDVYYTLPVDDEGEVMISEVDKTRGVVVDWNKTQKFKTEAAYKSENAFYGVGGMASDGSSQNSTGTGGSMARFTIAGDYLYTVNLSSLASFDIAEPSKPVKKTTKEIGSNIETIFPYNTRLFIGSQEGVYIYDISETPDDPVYLSQLLHVRSYDPVVVEGDYAYVTLRAGDFTGAENQLDIIDISSVRSPVLVKTYPMSGPYGLGISDSILYICDGTAGLKVYDALDPLDLTLLGRDSDIFAYDVIPVGTHIILTGENKVIQYSFENKELTHLSTYSY